MSLRVVDRPFAIPTRTGLALAALALAALPWLMLSPEPVRAEPRVRVRAATRIEFQAESLAGSTVVRGRLLDDQGQALSGQSVEIARVGAAAARSHTVATDDRGEFASEIEGAAAESIVASYAGDDLHAAASATMRVRAGQGGTAARRPAGLVGGRTPARPNSFWLLVPIGICALVVLASRRYRGAEAAGRAPRPWPWRGIRRSHTAAPASAAMGNLRARAAAAYRPAALAMLPSPALWGRATPRETLAHAAAARAGHEPPELRALTERVERACYARAAPDEEDLRAIEAAAARVVTAHGRPAP